MSALEDLGRAARAYPTLLRVGLAEAVAYRAEMLVWMLTTTMPLVSLALWSAVAETAPVGRFSQQGFAAYFLATLYKTTRDQRFLDGALAGAKYLLAIAKTEGDICLVQHDQPDGLDLYYLGWCHGPVGTARLFYQLSAVTGDKTWMTWVTKSANGILKSGIPERRTPGFWNNVSQCCGSAGVAQFFLDLYSVTNDAKYLSFAEKMTADLLARATRDVTGTRWVQAEHRVQPELLIAQTGYMQGAAGIGMWLLRLDGAQRKRPPFVQFPDSPWGPPRTN